MSIVRHNGSEEIDYKFTACPSFLNSWMTKLRNEEKEPGTIQTYLNSVKHFIDFCQAEDNHILDGQNTSQIRVLICKWRNTLYREMNEREFEKELKARDYFPSPEEIEKFDNSSLVKDAKKTISDSHIKGFKLSKLKFCLARDYILTSLIFDNASRPGAISNMTLYDPFQRE